MGRDLRCDVYNEYMLFEAKDRQGRRHNFDTTFARPETPDETK